MKLASFRRFSGVLCCVLVLGCDDGPDPSSVPDPSPAQAEPQPVPPETGEGKSSPKGPTAVSPTRVY